MSIYIPVFKLLIVRSAQLLLQFKLLIVRSAQLLLQFKLLIVRLVTVTVTLRYSLLQLLLQFKSLIVRLVTVVTVCFKYNIFLLLHCFFYSSRVN